MKTLPTLFFATGGLFALCGMIWGIQMSISHDHTLAPAHAHLNLIGFVLMSVFGTFYALSPRAGDRRLAKLHFCLATLSVVVMVPGIVMAITGRGEALAASGSVLAITSMALFIFVVLRHLFDGAARDADHEAVVSPQPAE
jgi:cbb3-type cytochrome oxidase subunit 1